MAFCPPTLDTFDPTLDTTDGHGKAVNEATLMPAFIQNARSTKVVGPDCCFAKESVRRGLLNSKFGCADRMVLTKTVEFSSKLQTIITLKIKHID
jgi:hypothetical protein